MAGAPSDMKGYLALMLALVPEWCAAGLEKPVHLVFSYDEENHLSGRPRRDRAIRREACAPPGRDRWGNRTGLESRMLHKTRSIYTPLPYTASGGEGAIPPSPALGANAVMSAAELVSEINRIGDDLFEAGDPSGRFDPPYSTVSVGTNQRWHRAQYPGEGMPLQLGDPGPAGLDIGRDRGALRGVLPLGRDAQAQPVRAVWSHRDPGGSVCPGAGARSGVRGRAQSPCAPQRAIPTIAVPYGTESRPVPEGRSLGGGVRPGQHRPGASAR